MGLMDKFKNLFTEEVEEEIKPIKKEVRHVEIPSPKRETRETREIKLEEMDDNVSDRSLKKEEKVSFPLYFDDKDFDDLEKPKKEEKPIKKEVPKAEAYQGAKVQKQEQRRFEASPIISPVYGVLDKNYKKEDIPTRKEQPNDYTRKPRSMTVDDIRNKAFGTLEDDLEDTLFGNKSILLDDELTENKEEPVIESAIDIFDELKLEEEPNISTEYSNELQNDIVGKTILSDSLQDDEMDEDTILLAKQLEEQKKKLEEINEYINESSPDENVLTETKEDSNERHAENISEVISEESIQESPEEVMESPVEESSEILAEKQVEEPSEDLTESELLNLVDAMYEKRDEE